MSQAISPSGPPRRRPRKWGRRVLLALLFLILIGAGSVIYYVWSSSAELAGVIAELDRLDPGWRLEEIEANRKLVPDATNSALQIMAIKKMLGNQSVISPELVDTFYNLPPQVQLNDQQAANLDKRFEVLGNALAQARKLKDMRDGRYPITYSVDFIGTIVNWQAAREVSELLQWDAARRVHAADADGALESCLALQHTARSIGDEPLLISQLVRFACNAVTVDVIERTLAQGHFTETSAPFLKQLQTALSKELQESNFLLALRGERAGIHHLFQGIAEGRVNTNSIGIITNIGIALGNNRGVGGVDLMAHFPGFFTLQHAALLRFHNNLVEAAKLSPKERDERFQFLEKKILEEPILVRLLVPAVIKIRGAERRTQANLLCTMAALAAERFRIAQNRWPESLDELVQSGFLDAVPTDPYDDKPVRVKRTGDGLAVYSVGPDRIDNGGNIDREHPTQPGTDQGFRLWDVPHRRQPPNPPVELKDDPK